VACSTARSSFWKSARFAILVERLPMRSIMSQVAGLYHGRASCAVQKTKAPTGPKSNEGATN
jgi:hypothetical protein